MIDLAQVYRDAGENPRTIFESFRNHVSDKMVGINWGLLQSESSLRFSVSDLNNTFEDMNVLNFTLTPQRAVGLGSYLCSKNPILLICLEDNKFAFYVFNSDGTHELSSNKPITEGYDSFDLIIQIVLRAYQNKNSGQVQPENNFSSTSEALPSS